MFRPVRTAISFAVLGGALWCAFAIDLGGHTFAEHVDTISDTPEAKRLIDGTRSTVNPALQEVRDRVLGEYVEAPTWIPSEAAPADGSAEPAPDLGARGAMHRGSSRRNFRRGCEANHHPWQLYRAYCKFWRQSPRRKGQARWREALHHGLLEPVVPASTLPPEPSFEPPLPGGQRPTIDPTDEPDAAEPPLPGRR